MDYKNKQAVWLTWHHASRSRNLADYFNLPIFELHLDQNALIRHGGSTLWTIWVLFRKRPQIIFLQLSFLLLLVASIYKLLCFNKVVIIADCHTKALRRKAKGFWNVLFWPLKKWSFQKVNVSIVHNQGMKTDIEELHDNYFILPDKIPEYRYKINKNKQERGTYCVYVSSFARDEPRNEIFKVAEILSSEAINIYWTGKVPASLAGADNDYPNLKFTGYMDFQQYVDLLGNADCILALTSEEDCLQSGAYEALNVNTPMVLSDTEALKSYFNGAALYTTHKPADIAENIKNAIHSKESLLDRLKKVKKNKRMEFEQLTNKLSEVIQDEIDKTFS